MRLRCGGRFGVPRVRRIEGQAINASPSGLAAALDLLLEPVVTWLAQRLQFPTPEQDRVALVPLDVVGNARRCLDPALGTQSAPWLGAELHGAAAGDGVRPSRVFVERAIRRSASAALITPTLRASALHSHWLGPPCVEDRAATAAPCRTHDTVRRSSWKAGRAGSCVDRKPNRGERDQHADEEAAQKRWNPHLTA